MIHRARIVSAAGRAYARCTDTGAIATGKYVVEALSKLRQVCKCQHRKEYNITEEIARAEATQFIRVHADRTEAVSAQNDKVLRRLTSNYAWR